MLEFTSCEIARFRRLDSRGESEARQCSDPAQSVDTMFDKEWQEQVGVEMTGKVAGKATAVCGSDCKATSNQDNLVAEGWQRDVYGLHTV